jgi:hypothetical protein
MLPNIFHTGLIISTMFIGVHSSTTLGRVMYEAVVYLFKSNSYLSHTYYTTIKKIITITIIKYYDDVIIIT